MTTRRFAIAAPVLLITSMLLTGCIGGGCSFSQGMMSSGSGQEGACNETNSFAYGTQGSVMSDTRTWQWENTEGQAEIAWGFQGAGSVTLTITDADGQQVYSDGLGGGGQGGNQATTQQGEPGTWTIQLRFSGFNGQMGVGLQAV